MVGKSKTFPVEAMWKRIFAIEDYPRTMKFVKSVAIPHVKVGTKYTDVTTLLWIPITVNHIITEVKEKEKLCFFLPLPLGAKMWHTFLFSRKGKEAIIRAEISFDLGNWLFNNTVGYILEKRWEELLLHAFPEIEDKKRVQ